MKSDLELLIEHWKTEMEYYRTSMEKCASELDFDRAKLLKKPYLDAKRQLFILENIKNPNHKSISRLTEQIDRLELSLTEKKFENSYFTESARIKMEAHFNESVKVRIQKTKDTLAKLKSLTPKPLSDNDKILNLIEQIKCGEIQVIEFEIIKGQVQLILNAEADTVTISLVPEGEYRLEKALITASKKALRKLGFDQLSKKIDNFREVDNLRLLEELSIIYFEVFSVFEGCHSITSN